MPFLCGCLSTRLTTAFFFFLQIATEIRGVLELKVLAHRFPTHAGPRYARWKRSRALRLYPEVCTRAPLRRRARTSAAAATSACWSQTDGGYSPQNDPIARGETPENDMNREVLEQEFGRDLPGWVQQPERTVQREEPTGSFVGVWCYCDVRATSVP